ncbi:uncharacterized protein LOC123322200 [Coccinella septempunctata]|uniref:uncharacterized protein LOC123322200 n=1 Tax=Coccinella septempunctata TaxID=41139 RepID=UPI001D0984E8|nr:uncharacterized protein LOC123322200 [Coccinella septempunctata]
MSDATVMRNSTSVNIPSSAHCVQGKFSRRSHLVAPESRRGQRDPFYAKENIKENKIGVHVKTRRIHSVGKTPILSSQNVNNARDQVFFKPTEPNSTSVRPPIKSRNYEPGYSNPPQVKFKLLPQLGTKVKSEATHTLFDPSPNNSQERRHNRFSRENSEFLEEKLLNDRSEQRSTSKARRRWKKPPANYEFQFKNGILKNVKRQTSSWCETNFKFRRTNNSNVTSENGGVNINIKKSEFGVVHNKIIRESACGGRKQSISDECALDNSGNCTLHGRTCDTYWRSVYLVKSMRLLERSLTQRESKSGKILNLLSVLKQEAENLCKTA